MDYEYKIFHFTEEGKTFRKIDNLKKFPNTPTKVVLFAYDDSYDSLKLFNKRKQYEYENTSFKIEYNDEESTLLNFKIRRNGEEEEDKNNEVFLLVLKKIPIAIMITNINSYYLKEKLRFFNKFYPFMSRVFFRSYEIERLLEFVEKEHEVDIFVKNYVVKRYYENPETRVCYERTKYKQVFKIASENYLWVDSILLEIEKENKIIFRVRISRKGIISFVGTDYSKIHLWIINNIIQNHYSMYRNILKNRSRTINNIEPRPVKISIVDEVFNEQKDIEQLMDIIYKGLNNWGYSILYQEGPYAFIMLHDYVTGSSYEMLICSKSEIFITPQTQVTPISFNNLLNLLLDNYDGSVENG